MFAHGALDEVRKAVEELFAASMLTEAEEARAKLKAAELALEEVTFTCLSTSLVTGFLLSSIPVAFHLFAKLFVYCAIFVVTVGAPSGGRPSYGARYGN